MWARFAQPRYSFHACSIISPSCILANVPSVGQARTHHSLQLLLVKCITFPPADLSAPAQTGVTVLKRCHDATRHLLIISALAAGARSERASTSGAVPSVCHIYLTM